ncbi:MULTISPECIES: LacI family DNA-binding transcriptional regulator [unclassified Tatumella]|uniref:LacI family DNA-binding transcriptional regulator n=1 Tax=unclassified Tatumella TaxID=2649542 RepID=UPI001BAF54B2|nr:MULTISPECIES: LacI family DNA-binding transcriptional regulator [unclassified Tatumella]MBS0878121.1 LacI family DNA-binding transcriptional regulator [Tatumella sp. JGM82]MBS0890480.1 LacI family DNA-binding transcriptional regulator [Tatumella sp. JGM94]MBS0900936.1 LacI family DNA-binding transcriptional regulator [Tatumella sp. JGM100]
MQISDADSSPKEKRRKGTGKITLTEVAEFVGVSAMTVSRALRMPEKVNSELRARIDAAVRQLGYVPNLQARNLASVHSDLILVVAPAFSSPGFLTISESLQAVLSGQGYTMMLMESGNDGRTEYKAFEKILAYNPAAIIQFNTDTIDSCSRLLSHTEVPILDIGALNPHSVGISIGVDYAKAVRMLVTQLSAASLKNIALLCTPANNRMSRQILSGWNTAMLSLNRSPHRVVATHLPSAITTGLNVFSDLMITWSDLDGLICTSDEIACGCMMACHNAGIKVPDTLAIASLGGSSLSKVCSPSLTTVEFPWHDIGNRAGKALLDLLNDVPGDKYIEMPGVLKIRASTPG